MKSKLLEILVCPQCKSELVLGGETRELHCAECRLAYPVRDGIPVLLISEARSTSNSEPHDVST